MKPRARRVTIGAAAVGAAVVSVLVLANWGTVREHVEAWHFQLTRETRTLEAGNDEDLRSQLQVLSMYSKRSVIFDPNEEQTLWPPEAYRGFTADDVLRQCREDGWRIFDQRFPRRAYVVTRYKPAPGQISEAPLRFRGASTTIELKAAPGTPRSPFSE